jgi:predicted O-methyltransferase YrrM
MPIPRPIHIETQDPKFFAFRQQTYYQWGLWLILSLLVVYFLDTFGLLLSLIGLGYLLLTTMLNLYHKIQIEQVQHYWQTEALFSLYATLKIRQPLPPMRLWAASPDFVTQAVTLIREHRPDLMVEIGSGVSTLISGYTLQEVGSGQLISLEHDAQFAETTAANLVTHQLTDVASVRHAPLQDTPVGSRTQPWYDLGALEDLPGPIDLLVVDGPPSGTCDMARYPALPLLFLRLRPGAYILVDDFMRDDEYAMVNRWVADYDLQVVRTFANEKGAAILQKVTGGEADHASH